MFETLHYRHLVHDPFGVVKDLLAGVLKLHFHHLFHREFIPRGYVIHQPDNATRTAAQLLANVVFAGDHLGQVVREVRLQVLEYKQLVFRIQDGYHIVRPKDTLLAVPDVPSTDIGSVPGLVLEEIRESSG